MFPSFSFPVCCLSCSFNGGALCNPYWERPEPNTIGRPSPIEPLSTTAADQTWRQKPTGLQQGRGLKCLALRYSLEEMCVWPQSISLFSAVWERECFLFIGGRAETLQEMAFISKTTCWKWYTVIAILTPTAPHLSVLQSCCISATTAVSCFVFLNVVLFRSSQQYLWGV